MSSFSGCSIKGLDFLGREYGKRLTSSHEPCLTPQLQTGQLLGENWSVSGRLIRNKVICDVIAGAWG